MCQCLSWFSFLLPFRHSCSAPFPFKFSLFSSFSLQEQRGCFRRYTWYYRCTYLWLSSRAIPAGRNSLHTCFLGPGRLCPVSANRRRRCRDGHKPERFAFFLRHWSERRFCYTVCLLQILTPEGSLHLFRCAASRASQQEIGSFSLKPSIFLFQIFLSYNWRWTKPILRHCFPLWSFLKRAETEHTDLFFGACLLPFGSTHRRCLGE